MLTYCDSIYSDTELFSYLCGSERSYIATVVGTIGEKNDYFRFRLTILDTIDSIGKSKPNGSTIFDNAKLYGIEQIDKYAMVGGKWALSETFASKYH